jgi:uncharacterized LabA/DUF88 family protein
MKMRIYIDFWNLQLNWINAVRRLGYADNVSFPWKDISSIITPKLGAGYKYVGANIYCSIDPQSVKDKKLKSWLTTYLSGLPGFKVIIKERKPAFNIKCNNCHKEISVCSHCGNSIHRTVEKGVDTAIVTDMIQHGIDDLYTAAVLITEDSDFVPAVDFLADKGKQVFHCYFKNKSLELRNACWGHFYIEDLNILPLPKSSVEADVTAPNESE